MTAFFFLRLCNSERWSPLPDPEAPWNDWQHCLPAYLPKCWSPCLPAHVCVCMHVTSPLPSCPPVRSTLGCTHCRPLVCRHRSGKERREGVHWRTAGAEEEKRPTGGGWRQVSWLDNFSFFPPKSTKALLSVLILKIKAHARFVFCKVC